MIRRPSPAVLSSSILPSLLLPFIFSFLLLLFVCTPVAAVCPEVVRQYIVSGQETPIDADLLAFTAVIHDSTGTCTATVLNDHYLLTAAHCSYKTGAKVRVGRRLRDGAPDSTVLRFVKHPQYSGNNILHDIAVVKLDPPLPKNNNNRYLQVTLHSGVAPQPPAFARVAGYGVTRPKSPTDKGMGIFRRVDLPVVNLTACTAALKDENYRAPPQFVDKNYLCAGYTGPNTCGGDACSGDSGGPIVVRPTAPSSAPTYVQVGVTSAGATCGEARVPGIYTSVAGHLGWIKSVATAGDKLKIVDAFAKPKVPPPPQKPKNPTAQAAKPSDVDKINNNGDGGESDNEIGDAGATIAPTPEPGTVNGRVGSTGLEKTGAGSGNNNNTTNKALTGSVVSIISVSVIVGVLLIALLAFFVIRRMRNNTEFSSEDFEGEPPSDLMARLGMDPEINYDDDAAPPSVASDTISDASDSNNSSSIRISNNMQEENNNIDIESRDSNTTTPSAPPPGTAASVGDTPSILGTQTVVPTARWEL